MKCVICHHGETRPALTTVTLDRGGVTVMIRNVPTDVCENCGEKYYSEATAAELRRELEAAQEAGGELLVRSFAA